MYTLVVENNVDPDASKQLGLLEAPDKLISYGDGFPLLFQFMKFIIIFLIVVFAFQGLCFLLLITIIFMRDNSTEDVDLDHFFSISLIQKEADEYPEIVYAYDTISMFTNFLVIFCI